MKKLGQILFYTGVLLLINANASESEETYWVNSDMISRHSCASKDCGILGRLFKGEKVTSYEETNGWIRITEYYDGECIAEKSRYVEEGEKSCTRANGFFDGQVADWVNLADFSNNKPEKPPRLDGELAQAIQDSDMFSTYKDEFLEVSKQLVENGKCTTQELSEQGGWVKATGDNINKPIFFTYCGGYTADSKIYFNAQTKQLLKN